jgi:hypothetical protein
MAASYGGPGKACIGELERAKKEMGRARNTHLRLGAPRTDANGCVPGVQVVLRPLGGHSGSWRRYRLYFNLVG